MADIVVFSFHANNVRTLTKDGETFFRASDVATVLGLDTGGMLQRIPDDEVILNDAIDTLGRSRSVRFLKESGLYRAILRSDKPEAEPFFQWVTKEVLPAIRKHGFYMTEKLRDQLAQKDIELTRKEAVIKRLQRKKQSRYLVPSEDHLEGFEPPLVSKPVEDLTSEQIAKAKQAHVIKTLNGIITKHILEKTKQEKADLIIALVSGLLE